MRSAGADGQQLPNISISISISISLACLVVKYCFLLKKLKNSEQ